MLAPWNPDPYSHLTFSVLPCTLTAEIRIEIMCIYYRLQSRYPAVTAIRAELERLVTMHAAEPALHAVPEAVTLLATPAAAAAQAPALAQLASWAPAPLLLCMSLLCTPAGRWATPVLDKE